MYPAPNLKTQPVITVTLNARVTVLSDDGKFSRLANGRYIYSRHLKPLGENDADFVAVAEMFRHVPYYWGGKSVYGLDCSGLVQLLLEACGRATPRDSDMQEAMLGEPVMVNDLDGLKRSDLVFWDGHVGIMSDERTLLHANGHHMMVVAEPLREAVERIAGSYGQISSIKRL
jgi:cell wall-associated NlpC family hydrolase